MKKTLSLFQRNYDGDRLVRDELVPGAEWVAAGEGVATRKHDGTCCMVRDGKLYKRHELKAGKTAPAGFEAAQGADTVGNSADEFNAFISREIVKWAKLIKEANIRAEPGG